MMCSTTAKLLYDYTLAQTGRHPTATSGRLRLRNFGERIRQEFMDEVEQTVLALTEMPTMGKLDPLFAHRSQAYRSIIVRRLNKVVYYVKGDTLHIAAFWDTRREPKNQAKQTK